MTGQKLDTPSTLAAATAYAVSGAITGVVGVPSTIIVAPNGLVAGDTVRYSDGGQGGAFTPPSLIWSNSSAWKGVTYTPGSPGSKQITFTSSGSLPIANSPWAFTATNLKNSWRVYSTGEQNQRQHPQYRLRSRYIRTDDPLPNMNYKQLEKALPPNYDLPLSRPPMEGEEALPEFFEEETLQLDEPYIEEEIPLVEESPQLAVEESPQPEEVYENYIHLNPARGFIGDEISLETDMGLPAIEEVFVNGFKAEFVVVSPKSLIFEIPMGATSGMVELITPDRDVISAGILEVDLGGAS